MKKIKEQVFLLETDFGKINYENVEFNIKRMYIKLPSEH